MRTNVLTSVAVMLGISFCTIAQAESPYHAPSNWNHFRKVAYKTDSVPTSNADLPAPRSGTADSIVSTPVASVDTGLMETGSPDNRTLSAAWTGAEALPGATPCGDGTCPPAIHASTTRAALSPWFGGADLLFYTLETDRGRAVAYDFNGRTNVWTDRVDPEASVGFDLFAGRYLDDGRYGLEIGYMLWNPSSESNVYSSIPGDIEPTQDGYDDLFVDGGLGAADIYGIVYGASGAYAGADALRIRRDLRFQGIEANLFNFGLMGAKRAAYAECNPGDTGYGGAAGPLVRPSSGRVRIMSSHGFRWFQIDDDFELAFNTDTNPGYQQDDIYDNVDVTNNLYGYQFGSMLTYCVGCRMNVNIGGKFGIYGNDIAFRHRVGTRSSVASLGLDEMNVSNSEVVLATLGELDLGLGLRLTHRWSVCGGYRLMGVSGVVDAVEVAKNTNYLSAASASEIYADDSFILHGGYFGVTCNW